MPTSALSLPSLVATVSAMVNDTQRDPFVEHESQVSGMLPMSHSPPPMKTTFEPSGTRLEREPTSSSTYYMGSPTIPTTHKARTLVLCFDGTGDQSVFSLTISNVSGTNSPGIRFDADVRSVASYGACKPLITITELEYCELLRGIDKGRSGKPDGVLSGEHSPTVQLAPTNDTTFLGWNRDIHRTRREPHYDPDLQGLHTSSSSCTNLHSNSSFHIDA